MIGSAFADAKIYIIFITLVHFEMSFVDFCFPSVSFLVALQSRTPSESFANPLGSLRGFIILPP